MEKVDPKEALEYLAQNPLSDLIIMDLTFPYMSAEEFVNKLEENSTWKVKGEKLPEKAFRP